MKVFISWAGAETKPFAAFLHEWLQLVIQSVKPWMSEIDVAKGSRSMAELGRELEGTDFGVVVLTAANQHSPWINFEAGAISKSVGESGVIPLLLDLKKSDVTGPLSQFQAVDAGLRVEVVQLVTALNAKMQDPLPESRLAYLVEREWERFSAEVGRFRDHSERSSLATSRRSDRDVLDEILLAVRDINKRSVLAQSPVFTRKSQTNQLEGK